MGITSAGRSCEDRIRQGHFDANPASLRWDQSARFAYLLNDGYGVTGVDALALLANGRLAQAEAGGGWRGTAAELWSCLFFERSGWRHAGDVQPPPEQEVAVDELCETLRQCLLNLTAADHSELLAQFAGYPFGRTGAGSGR